MLNAAGINLGIIRYRLPALVSSGAAIVAAFSIFIWALVKQGNGGPLFSNPEAVYGVDKLKGSQLGWVMMRCITSGIGAWSGGVRPTFFFSDLRLTARRFYIKVVCIFSAIVLAPT